MFTKIHIAIVFFLFKPESYPIYFLFFIGERYLSRHHLQLDKKQRDHYSQSINFQFLPLSVNFSLKRQFKLFICLVPTTRCSM